MNACLAKHVHLALSLDQILYNYLFEFETI
jgi:hypothetical protein